MIYNPGCDLSLHELKQAILSLVQFNFIVVAQYFEKGIEVENYNLSAETLNDVNLALINRAEFLIKGYLEKNCNDIEALFLLAMVALITPMEDDIQAIECMKKILKIDPFNYKALLILAFEEHVSMGMIDNQTFNALQKFKTNDHHVQSLIELAKSWYYFGKNDWQQYQNVLQKSIELSDHFSNNYIDLGRECLRQNEIELGNQLIEKGYKNKVIKKNYNAESEINYEEFIDAQIKGIIEYTN